MVKGKHYISALDIGTSKVIALIGEVQEDNQIHIVGIGQAPSLQPHRPSNTRSARPN